MRIGVGTGAAALLVAPLALVVLHGGGSRPESLVPAATLALLAAAGLVAAAAWGAVPWPAVGRPGALLIGALTAYVVWGGITTVWSIAPDRSWSWLNRGLVYLAFLALGLLLAGALPRARSVFALALAAVVGVALLWGLVGVVFPDVGPDVELSARLREPVGYWNALAVVFALGMPPALWLAVDEARAGWLRALAVAGLAGGLVGIALTGSRGGLVAAGIAIAVWLALSRRRVEGGLAVALAALAAVVVAAVVLPLPGIGDTGASPGDRRRDGAILGLLLALTLGAAGVAWVRGLDRLATGRRRRVTARLLAVAAVVVVVAAVAGGSVAVARGGPVCNPPSEQVTQNAGRILETSFNNRCTWWRNAIDIWRHDAGAGTGGGTFELARRPLREDTQQPLAPHDLPLQALAETGLVGFVLLLVAAAAALWVLVRPLRGPDVLERAAAVALTASLAAWAAHALVDMAWEYPAVTAPAFAALGVLAGQPGARRGGRRPLTAFAAIAFGVVALASVASPWLAERRLDTAAAAAGEGRLGAADEAAADAHGLNPLSISPLVLRASIAEAERRPDEARALLREAVDLQPRNPDTWYELGRHYLEVRDDPATAFCALDRAYALDSQDLGTNDLLVAARSRLNGRRPTCRYG